MSVNKRLKEYIKSQKKTISHYEKEISVSNGYVNSISKGVGGEVLLNILEKSPNLNIEWLLTGNGSMLKNDEKNILNQSITGDSNIQSGNNTSIAGNYVEHIKKLESELQECKIKLDEKDKTINKLVNLISSK